MTDNCLKCSLECKLCEGRQEFIYLFILVSFVPCNVFPAAGIVSGPWCVWNKYLLNW